MRFLASVPLLFIACGHTGYRAPLTAPDRGGPAWTEVDSPHFRVFTDQSAAVARETSRTLEEAYEAFAKLMSVGMVTRAAPVGRIDFIAFDRKEDFLAVSPLEQAQAIFKDPALELESQPTIVSWGKLGEHGRIVLQHELAHRFIRHTLRFVPVWLNEGLAEYFSTFELVDGVARFGKKRRGIMPISEIMLRHGSVGAASTAARMPSLEKLSALDWAHFHDESEERFNYMGAWALVHYFEHTPDLRPRFRDYQRRLANGEEPRPAFDAAFEGVERARIDREFREQAAAPGMAVLEGKFAVTPAQSETGRPLDPAEVRLLFARLLPWSRANTIRIRGELDEAARLAPSSGAVANLRSWFELRSGHVQEAEDAARQAVTLAPSEPRFQFTLAAALHERLRAAPAPRDYKPLRALLKPLWPAAQSAVTLNLLGSLYAELGEPDLALPFAQKAVDADPACWACLGTLARILTDTGFLAEALPVQERAIALLPEKVKIPQFQKRLEALRAAARAQASP